MQDHGMPLEEMLDVIREHGVDLEVLEVLDLSYDEVRDLYFSIRYR